MCTLYTVYVPRTIVKAYRLTMLEPRMDPMMPTRTGTWQAADYTIISGMQKNRYGDDSN